MAFEPNKITRDHILEAVKKIKSENIDLIPSTRWDVIINGEDFPPKEIMRYAHEQMNGEKTWDYSGGEQTNKYLKDLGFDIVDKTDQPIQEEIIERYKELIQEDGNEEELYKWRLIQESQKRWDIDADDFAGMAQGIDFKNLLDYRSKTLIHFVDEYPEEARDLFKMLYDETKPLKKRIEEFGEQAEQLVKKYHPDKGAFQDERTVATYLTFRYPDKYTFYKYSFYSDFADLLEVDKPQAGERYIHYLDLMREFIDEYISQDEELIQLSRDTLTDDCYIDENLNILAQDILFRVIEGEGFPSGGEDDFKQILGAIGYSAATNYFNTLDMLVRSLDLSKGDQRVVYSTRSRENRLVFTIGQRYTFNYEAKKEIPWGFIHPGKKSKAGKFKAYSGPPEAYWHETDQFNHIQDELEAIKEACQAELDRTEKSGYLKYNNDYFEKAVFNKEYRDSVFNALFEQKFVESLKVANNGKSSPKLPTQLKMAVNTILYGPPGTGKTYRLRNDYAPKFTQEQKLKTKEEFEIEVIEELSWWEVIALALLEAGNLTVPEIKKHRFIQIKENLSDTSSVNATIWGQLQTHTSPESTNVNTSNRQEPYLFDKLENSVWSLNQNDCEQKTPYLLEALESIDQYEPEVNAKQNYRFTTFHQSFTYEDFVEGIKPRLNTQSKDSDSEGIEYTIEKGVFYQAADEACKLAGFLGLQDCLSYSPEKRKAKFSEAKPYALFIDEINRGNISAILGELITLIEDDKRLTKDHELIVQLPYSKKSFAVPPNLYILGTLNTADRSVEALDTALRRRFSFIEIEPDPNLLNGVIVEGINIEEILRHINLRIVKLLDRDHKIGHSYFLPITEDTTKKDLAKIFEDRVIPLLKEYFFGDFGKIGLVLGSSFVEEIHPDNTGVFAQFSGYEDVAAEYDERKVYTISPKQKWDFESIYTPKSKDE